MPVSLVPDFPMSKMVHNQDWADPMPAMILLVAVLERTTWKYHDPNAYRVVLIEAGHIAQNIMLACTERGLTACPTAALCHSVISQALGLECVTHFPVYALTLGHPAPSSDTTYSVEEGLARQNTPFMAALKAAAGFRG
jgi:SagB-type dehydrogenase family enzyme